MWGKWMEGYWKVLSLEKRRVLILTNAKSRTCNTMDNRANHSDLPLVDGEVRTAGSL